MPTDQSEFFVYSCYDAAVVLIAYDTLLTFSCELDYIWRRKFSMATVLLVTQRYCALVGFILNITNPTQLWSCKMVIIIQYITDILRLLGVAIFSIIRVWTLYRDSDIKFLVTGAVFLCSMIVPSVNIYNYSRPQVFTIEDGQCDLIAKSSLPKSVPVMTRSLAIAPDVLVLFFMWNKIYKESRAQIKPFGSKISISSLLIRDGSLYFGALLALNIVTLVLDTLYHDAIDGTSAFIFINEAIACNLIIRFFLDLRQATTYSGTSDGDFSSLQFAPPTAGNIGVPRRQGSTWTAGSIDDIANERDLLSRHMHEEADAPFSVGPIPRDSDVSDGHQDTDESDVNLHAKIAVEARQISV